MGGVPHPDGEDETSNAGFSLCGMSQNGTPHRPAPLRPCVSPLFSTLSAKPYISAPLSNSFRFNYFQTPKKAPLCKPFRIIAFQNLFIFSGSSAFNLELSALDYSPNYLCFQLLTRPPTRKYLCFQLLTKKTGGGPGNADLPIGPLYPSQTRKAIHALCFAPSWATSSAPTSRRPGNFTGLVLGGTSSRNPANLLNSGHL
jgi:hypothetical protein